MDRDSEVPKSRNLQSWTKLIKLCEVKIFFFLTLAWNVVSFIEGLRPNKIQLARRRVCKVQ
jgi:hypothetical protein